jgi:16S rRNA pseudouridine516 synthase
MQLADILFSEGFGTRRDCAGLVGLDLVQVELEGKMVSAQSEAAEAYIAALKSADDLSLTVRGTPWRCHTLAYVLLHKPAGYECSHKPGMHPSVYSLLPSPLRLRPAKTGLQGVQTVGRLDQDTTGLLLLSDDGQFIHRLTSPKHHVPKVYEVQCKHGVDEKQIARLLEGVVLDDSPKPVRAAACVQTGETSLQLTLTEGKYHQVKRMLAAVSNRVEGLHRSQMGTLGLDALELGEWRYLLPEEVQALLTK